MLGSKFANVECSLLGRESTSVAALMSPLVGKVIQLSHADWDARRGMLKHMPSTLVKPLEEEHDLHDADFIYVPFDAIPSMTPWSRVSVSKEFSTLWSSQQHHRRMQTNGSDKFQCQTLINEV